MDMKVYQECAKTTVKYDSAIDDILDETINQRDMMELSYLALGLNGESGEVADKVKKLIRDDLGYLQDKKLSIALELGDVLWYVSVMADMLGYSLDDIALLNIDKLQSRQKRNTISGNGDVR